MDDGTYLARIDPVGGRWTVLQIGGSDFSRFEGWVNFSAGGFLNHGAGCGGGYPAFYRLDGQKITVTRQEPVRIGKCAGTAKLANGPAAAREIAAESERRLASFIEQLSGWSRQGNTLMLTGRDGTRATLMQPVEPHPEIAGRWLIESIGGEPLVTERRPATLTVAMGGIGAYPCPTTRGAAWRPHLCALPSRARQGRGSFDNQSAWKQGQSVAVNLA